MAALSTQTAAAIEIVVVDDGSVDPARVAAIVEASPNARLVRLEGAGPAAARNAGVRAASGSVVLFTDDDCIPDQTWVERLSAAVRSEPEAVTGGTTVPLPGSPATVRATEAITRVLASRTPFRATNNVGTARSLLLAFPFDERFAAAAGEDRDWCARLDADGIEIRTAPDAVVVHAPAAGVSRFWRQHVRYGRAARTFRASGKGLPPSFYVALVEQGFREGFGVGLLVLVAQLASAVGFVSGPRRLPDRVSS
jgi:GT2 family glycosyltransferase